jgi:1,2-diacylglycerol 3-alpha-glucosyltransferase
VRVLVACSGVGHVFRGFETASEELAEVLPGVAGGEIEVTLARGGGGWRGRRGIRLPCVARGGRVARRLGLDGPRAYLVEQRTFAPWAYVLARAGRFDVVHLHDPGLSNALWHARRLLGGRFAILLTNGGPLDPEHLGRPDIIQSVTPVDAARLREAGFAPWQVAMVPHGWKPRPAVAAGEGRDGSRGAAADRPPRDFAPGPPRALIGVGTLNDSHKGFATAIRALRRLPEARLTLLGQRDAETPDIEALGRELGPGRVVTGTVRAGEVPEHLARAEAFVLPTHYEGFCIAVLEAMGAGLPCVVSDIPVLRWLVGDAGVLVAPDRPDAWAEAIAGLGPARRRELGERARARAAGFAWERLGPDYAAMYRQALEARARRAAGERGGSGASSRSSSRSEAGAP